MAQLRVVTYNIHHGADARENASLDRIADVIAGSGCDVACLQEVDREFSDRSRRADQVAELCDRLQMHGHFAAAINRGSGGYGNAILSKTPMTARDSHALPTRTARESRIAAVATIELGSATVGIISTHLSVGRQDRADRVRQVKLLRQLVERMSTPVVLAADFNSTSRIRELRALEAILTDAERGYRRTLGWPGRLRSVAVRAGATYPAWRPVKRIDRVYVTSTIEIESVKVLSGNASDHRALSVDLNVH